VPGFIPDETFGSYFEDFAHTAWRLEARRAYGSDRRSPNWPVWQADPGHDFGAAPANPWRANIRRQTGAGKRIERVRVADDPLTDGQSFLLAVGAANVSAGEDIRHLPRATADELALGDEDFWLFDSARALVLHFDQADEYLGSELVTDPERLLRMCQVRDAAWHHAVPRAQFAEQVRSKA
jgi:hypothetical protein